MGLTIKVVLALVLAAGVGLIGYAYFPGALTPVQTEVTRPVVLNADQ